MSPTTGRRPWTKNVRRLSSVAPTSSRDTRACAKQKSGVQRRVLGLGALSAFSLECVTRLAPADSAEPFAWTAVKFRDDASKQRRLDPALAPLFTRALYDAVQELKVMPEVEFQTANFRFREREYKYYYEANKDRLDRIPDLSDMSGGLSNPCLFNFVHYCTWKVAASRIKSPEDRAALLRAVGCNLLDSIAPDAKAAVQQSRNECGGHADIGVLRREVEGIVSDLQERGYLDHSQIVWGQSSLEVPYRWERDEERVVNVADDSMGALSEFQIRMKQPADIEGSVSFRSEEDGFWWRSVSSMLQALFVEAGYNGAVDEWFLQDEWSPPTGILDRVKLFFGDPLMEVDVPWLPQSLIQNWRVSEA